MSELTFVFLWIGAMLLFTVWWTYAAYVEYKERFDLLKAAMGNDILFAEYHSVHSNKHFLFILLFRSRRTLYPKIYASLEGNESCPVSDLLDTMEGRR